MGKIFGLAAMMAACAFTSVSFTSCDKENDTNDDPKSDFVSKVFTISLPCASVTGNYWVWANKEEAAADSLGRHIESVNMGPDIATSLENDVWTFQTKEEGVNYLKFRYVQPYGENEPQDTTFIFEK